MSVFLPVMHNYTDNSFDPTVQYSDGGEELPLGPNFQQLIEFYYKLDT